MKTLSEEGERNLIKEILKIFNEDIHDDCAVLQHLDGDAVITTDCISEKAHIPKGVSWKKVGRFFGAINLSDVAAMGAVPKFFLSGGVLPKDFCNENLIEFFTGLKEILDEFSVRYVGGDIKEGSAFSFCGVCVGLLPHGKGMFRDRWKEGDIVGITGNLGKAAAGYILYGEGQDDGSLILDVNPRVREGIALREVGVEKCMDLSDGVYASALQLMEINDIGFEFYLSDDILHPLALKVHKEFKVDKEFLAFGYGGDYELMFAVAEDEWESLEKKMVERGFPVKKIGKVIKEGLYVVIDGVRKEARYEGYEHFR